MRPFSVSTAMWMATLAGDYRAVRRFPNFIQFLAHLGKGGAWRILHGKFPEDWQGSYRLIYKDIQVLCKDHELFASLATTIRINDALEDRECKSRSIYELGMILDERLRDELEARKFLALSPTEARYYENWREGWEEIIDRFGDATRDIEEMAKCYALERYSASVFHSLQVVEHGVIELGRVICVKDHESAWNPTVTRLEEIIKTPWDKKTPFQKEHHKFLEQIRSLVEALKNAWRNKINHAHDKPILMTSDFSPKIAHEIMTATEGFMRRLATECPTARDPDA